MEPLLALQQPLKAAAGRTRLSSPSCRIAGLLCWVLYWVLFVRKKMVEPLLSGILLGLIPVTLSGLFVTAYLQYRRGDQLNL